MKKNTGNTPATLPFGELEGTKARSPQPEAIGPIINQQIIIRPTNRQKQDISKWRNAHRNAESQIPRRVLLYDLYFDVILDGHVIAVLNKRTEAVTNAKWQFVDTKGEPIDDINDMLDSIGFETALTEILNAKFWGYTTLEFTFYKDEENKTNFTTTLIPRKHYRPETGLIAYEQTGDTGFNIREGNIYPATVLEAGDTKDLGLLLSVAQYAILKDGGISDYAQFVEIFGRPLIDAEWDGYDETQRIRLNETLANLGGGNSIVRPAGTKLTFIEAKTNADGSLQTGYLNFLNQEISKAILGNTETTESSDTSGYAQAQTHANSEGKKNESDVNFVRRILNSRFRKILTANGIDTKGGKFIIKHTEEQLSKKDAFEINKSMKMNLNIPISDDYFYKEYDVDKPEDYEAQKNALEAEKKALLPETGGSKPEAQSPNNAHTPPASSTKSNTKPNTPEGNKLQKLVRFTGEDLTLWERLKGFFA